MHIRKEVAVPVLTGAVALATGFGAGYIIGKRNSDVFEVVEPEVEIETVVECENCKQRSDEVAGMVNTIDNEDYATFSTGQPVVDVFAGEYNSRIRKQAEEDMDAIQYGHPSAGLTLVENDDWDQDEEEENRSPNAPYVIHKNEWDADERGFVQSSLRWFAGDQVLVDEQTVPIPRPEKVVGRLEFGRGSGEENVVYIRNEEFEAEYEITRIDGSYVHDILGLEAEEEAEAEDLKHSTQILRFRD